MATPCVCVIHCRRELGFVCEDITGDAQILEAYADFRGPITLARMRRRPGRSGGRRIRGSGGTAGGGKDFDFELEVVKAKL